MRKTVSLPTLEYRDAVSLLRSTTTTEPKVVERHVHDALFEINRAVKNRDSQRLSMWAVGLCEALDPVDVSNLLNAGCNAIAKAVLRTNRGQFAEVTSFLDGAQRLVAQATRTRLAGLAQATA